MNQKKKALAGLLGLCALLLLSACRQNPPQAQLYQKLLSALEAGGYACEIKDAASDTPVGIYNASVWKALQTGEETVLVYFDESNRADYLMETFDQQTYGYAVAFGQRFILNYRGQDEGLLAVLQGLPDPLKP